MLGTSGRNDVNSLGAIATCCAGAFASLRVQIAYAISRTGVPISPTTQMPNKKPRLFAREGFVFGTVAGLMAIAFWLLPLAAQAPSLCSASKLLSQLVEPGCRSRRQLIPNKKPRLERGRVLCLVPVAGLEPARF